MTHNAKPATPPQWTEKAKNSFWSKVDQSAGPNACWPWTRSTRTTGYGQVNMGTRSKAIGAHRVAYILKNGIPTGTGSDNRGVCILHSCDNRLCCNPSHLRAGTHKDNLADMMRKGRHVTPMRASAEVKRKAAAYQQLVAALRDLLADADPESQNAGSQIVARALLRSLGEAQ